MKLNSFTIKPRATDFLFGDGRITFKAVTNGDWSSHLQFDENQSNANGDTDDCVIFTFQESFDAQMDVLIANGTIPVSVVNQLATMGYLQQGLDGKLHFHSSPRYIGCLTGNETNGNSFPDAFDAARQYGMIPWSDLPFTPSMTIDEYYAPVPESLLQKGQQFLSLMGGKNCISYHWLNQNSEKNVAQMQSAILQAPLCLGIAVVENGWNQVTPTDPPATQPVQHAVLAYSIMAPSVNVFDHYVPYNKVLDAEYPIPYVAQMVVTYLAPVEQQIVSDTAQVISQIPSAPISQQSSLLSAVQQILATILSWIQN